MLRPNGGLEVIVWSRVCFKCCVWLHSSYRFNTFCGINSKCSESSSACGSEWQIGLRCAAEVGFLFVSGKQRSINEHRTLRKGICLSLLQVTNDLIVILFDTKQLQLWWWSQGPSAKGNTQVHRYSPIGVKFQMFLLDLFQALHFADGPWELNVPPRSHLFIHLEGCFHESTVAVYSQLTVPVGRILPQPLGNVLPTF